MLFDLLRVKPSASPIHNSTPAGALRIEETVFCFCVLAHTHSTHRSICQYRVARPREPPSQPTSSNADLVKKKKKRPPTSLRYAIGDSTAAAAQDYYYPPTAARAGANDCRRRVSGKQQRPGTSDRRYHRPTGIFLRQHALARRAQRPDKRKTTRRIWLLSLPGARQTPHQSTTTRKGKGSI